MRYAIWKALLVFRNYPMYLYMWIAVCALTIPYVEVRGSGRRDVIYIGKPVFSTLELDILV